MTQSGHSLSGLSAIGIPKRRTNVRFWG